MAATGSQIGATLGMALPAALLWPAQAPGQIAWLSLLVLGALCTGVAYLLYFGLLSGTSPFRALAVPYLIPLFAVSYGIVLLGHKVTPGIGQTPFLQLSLITILSLWRRGEEGI